MRYLATIEVKSGGVFPIMPPIGKKYGKRSTWPTRELAIAAIERKAPKCEARGVVYVVADDGTRTMDYTVAL